VTQRSRWSASASRYGSSKISHEGFVLQLSQSRSNRRLRGCRTRA
jgi:hypothetical protein